MTLGEDEIARIRRDIDAIDAELRRLLSRRMGHMASLGEEKRRLGERSAYRPEREAEIFRALAKNHEGAMPLGSLIRIWQEICAAASQIQMGSPVTVACIAPRGLERHYADMARAQCGAEGRALTFESAKEALAAVEAGDIALAFLPDPSGGAEESRWWEDFQPPLQIVMRLPFMSAPMDSGEDKPAPALFVAARQIWRASGADATLIRVEAASLEEALSSLKEARPLGGAVRLIAKKGDRALIVSEGYIAPEDPRWRALSDFVADFASLGGFPLPPKPRDGGAK